MDKLYCCDKYSSPSKFRVGVTVLCLRCMDMFTCITSCVQISSLTGSDETADKPDDLLTSQMSSLSTAAAASGDAANDPFDQISQDNQQMSSATARGEPEISLDSTSGTCRAFLTAHHPPSPPGVNYPHDPPTFTLTTLSLTRPPTYCSLHTRSHRHHSGNYPHHPLSPPV